MRKALNSFVAFLLLLVGWNAVEEPTNELVHVGNELSGAAEETPSLFPFGIIQGSVYLPEQAEPYTGYYLTILPYTVTVSSGNPVSTNFGGNGIWKVYDRGWNQMHQS